MFELFPWPVNTLRCSGEISKRIKAAEDIRSLLILSVGAAQSYRSNNGCSVYEVSVLQQYSHTNQHMDLIFFLFEMQGFFEVWSLSITTKNAFSCRKCVEMLTLQMEMKKTRKTKRLKTVKLIRKCVSCEMKLVKAVKESLKCRTVKSNFRQQLNVVQSLLNVRRQNQRLKQLNQ